MKRIIENVFVIAQKEFADHLWSPRFRVLLSVFTLIIFSFSVRAGKYGVNIFEQGFLDVAQIIGLFLPIVGLSLGFDAIIKEKDSNSLNTILTHPVFRDTIITGKIIGGLETLALVIFISVIASVGTILVLTGVQIGWGEFNRILIFTVVTFIYLSTFLALGLLTSVCTNNSTNSFIYSIVIWINLVLIFGAIVSVTASLATGESILDLDNNHNALILNTNLQNLSPTHHYSEVVTGLSGFSVGCINFIVDEKMNSGIFDTNHTLGDWFKEYWPNLIALIITPILLFIASIVTFLRKDITG